MPATVCFWLGASDPHRGYDKGSGAEGGIDLSKIALPACLPTTGHPLRCRRLLLRGPALR
ncbi:MAG: hypothetical protein R3F11_03375 [Verrucomicrobiales bacterium]